MFVWMIVKAFTIFFQNILISAYLYQLIRSKPSLKTTSRLTNALTSSSIEGVSVISTSD